MHAQDRSARGRRIRLRTWAARAAVAVAMMAMAGLAVAAGPDEAEVPQRTAACDISLQVGWLEHIGDAGTRDGKSSFLIVGDICALWGPRPGSPTAAAGGLTRRGLAIHLSGDDDGGRHGLGYVHRRYANAGRHGYIQFMPVVILAADDNYCTVELPSAYVSLQAGNDRSFALCLALEIVRYRDALLSYAHGPGDPPDWNSLAVIDPRGTQVAWHVGAVLHGWPGVVGLVALGLGVGMAMSSGGL